MKTPQTATLIGATGLIGSHLLALLEQDDTFSSIKVLVRRPIAVASPKTDVIVIDFTNLQALKLGIAGSDVVFCSVGTTQQKVKGNAMAYRKVDYDIPVQSAICCAEMGVQHFLLVSSVGADSNSNNFYLKLKGEVEDAIKTMNIPSVSVFRPSMLLGNRQEFRLGEKIGQPLMRLFAFLIPSKYKPIEAQQVAKAMFNTTKQQQKGVRFYHFKEMVGL
jgi:uncharacterized protein YbjT (DUF2867 family)